MIVVSQKTSISVGSSPPISVTVPTVTNYRKVKAGDELLIFKEAVEKPHGTKRALNLQPAVSAARFKSKPA